MNTPFDTGPGRRPPPEEHRFLKGTSGNKKGRPKGTVDVKRLTRKVALRKHSITDAGRIVKKTALQLVIESVLTRAAAGVPSMVALSFNLRTKLNPAVDEVKGGLLVVPETATSIDQFLADEEERLRDARDPTTYVNHKSEEFCKAVQGIHTPLGQAVLDFHRRWRSSAG